MYNLIIFLLTRNENSHENWGVSRVCWRRSPPCKNTPAQSHPQFPGYNKVSVYSPLYVLSVIYPVCAWSEWTKFVSQSVSQQSYFYYRASLVLVAVPVFLFPCVCVHTRLDGGNHKELFLASVRLCTILNCSTWVWSSKSLFFLLLLLLPSPLNLSEMLILVEWLV